jgi:uncharacterized protein HemX
MKTIAIALALAGAATPATAACTFWPGQDNRAWENCMQLERQKVELQRLQSQQWLQEQQLRQIQQQNARPQNCGSRRCS